MDTRFQNNFAQLLAEIDVWVDDAFLDIKRQTSGKGGTITPESISWFSTLTRIRAVAKKLTTDWHKAFTLNGIKNTGAWFFVRDYRVAQNDKLSSLTAFWAEETVIQPRSVQQIISSSTLMSCWDGYFDSLVIQSVKDAAVCHCSHCNRKVPVVGYRELSKDHMDPSDFLTALHTFCLYCRHVAPLADRYTKHRD